MNANYNLQSVFKDTTPLGNFEKLSSFNFVRIIIKNDAEGKEQNKKVATFDLNLCFARMW